MKVQAQNITVISGSFDEIFADVNGGFVFWGDHYVNFSVVSGTWNGSDGQITVKSDSGTLVFTAQDNCSIEISVPETDRTFEVATSGATLTKSDGDYGVVITSGPKITITWRYLPWSMIDNYFMLGVGLTGILFMIAGPTWVAREFVKHGLTTEAIEKAGYAMLFLIMGFGFMVIWLWP